MDPYLGQLRWAVRPNRLHLEILGADRARFLHNLTTNDIKRLSLGQGCEAFVTSSQGRTLGFVTVLACEESLWLRADAAAEPWLSPHFAKYGALDDVQILDRSQDVVEILIVGEKGDEVLEMLGFPRLSALDYTHQRWNFPEARGIRQIRESPLGVSGQTILVAPTDQLGLLQSLEDAASQNGTAFHHLTDGDYEFLRISAGTPVFGQDLSEKNLPQELGRDSQAISFVKGCYLGQETVARLDALGHVNRLLRGLTLQTEVPPPAGTRLLAGDKEAGTITSSAHSAHSRGSVALAYVKSAHLTPGTTLSVPIDEKTMASATVCEFPIAS